MIKIPKIFHCPHPIGLHSHIEKKGLHINELIINECKYNIPLVKLLGNHIECFKRPPCVVGMYHKLCLELVIANRQFQVHPYITLDVGKICQVFYNLCSNSWALMLHWEHGSLQQYWSDHFVVTGWLHLCMHHDSRICHSNEKIMIVCIHIWYPMCIHIKTLKHYQLQDKLTSSHSLQETNPRALQMPTKSHPSS